MSKADTILHHRTKAIEKEVLALELRKLLAQLNQVVESMEKTLTRFAGPNARTKV